MISFMHPTDTMLTGKRFLVFGVANEESIAWHIAKHYKRHGAIVFIAYQMRFKSRVLQLLKTVAPEVSPDGLVRCDVAIPSEVDEAMAIASEGGNLDGIVHSVAYAPPETFGKAIHELTATEFAQALHVSAFSLIELVRAALPHFAPEASVTAMTYIGSARVIPGYKLMGIAKATLEACVRELAADVGPRGVRVNAISAGPLKTLAALAVPDFDRMLESYAAVAPLRSAIEPGDVAELAGFLASSAARRITGQVLFVDGGFGILGAAVPR
jgi:enoyl-[acyl-carrier protein] reductase I